MERFVYIASCGGTVTDIRNDDALFVVDLFVERRAEGKTGRATDDGVVGIGAKGGKEDVHGAAEALIKACGLTKDLSQRAVEQEVKKMKEAAEEAAKAKDPEKVKKDAEKAQKKAEKEAKKAKKEKKPKKEKKSKKDKDKAKEEEVNPEAEATAKEPDEEVETTNEEEGES